MSSGVKGSTANRIMRKLRDVSIWSVLSSLLGVAFFFARFGGKVLDPRQIDWLLARGDPSSYYLIWSFFRFESWGFPLGAVSSYLYPMGTSVPLVDGLALLAIPMKLFSGVLPVPFQYYGAWLLLCYVLQGFWGQRLAKLAVGDGPASLLGGGLFLLTPTFMFRQGHIALSSHWVLLAGLWLYLAGARLQDRSYYRSWAVLLAVVALIHPYLVIMVMVFFVAGNLTVREGWSWQRRAGVTLAGGAVVLLTWWVAGYFVGMGGDAMTSTGFGKYSSNLNTFVNSMGLSTILQKRALLFGQYEGFGYLGMGWLLLIMTSLVLFGAIRKPDRRHVLLMVAVAIMYLYSLSNKVVLGDRILLEYQVPEFLNHLVQTFRASGRFIWPLTYVACFWFLRAAAFSARRVQLLALLAVAFGLQVVDLQGLAFQRDHFASLNYQSRLASEHWDTLAARAGCLVAFPPFQHNTQNKGDFSDIAYLASRHRIPTTAGYAGRISQTKAEAIEDTMLAVIARGQADPSHLFLVERGHFPDVYLGLGSGWRAARLNGYHVCWSEELECDVPVGFVGAERISLASFLVRFKDRSLLMAIRDEGSAHLSDAARQELTSLGVDLTDLKYRGSLAAIVHEGRCVWQETAPDKAVSVDLAGGQKLGDFVAPTRLQLESAGYLVGNRAVIELGGRYQCFNRRGFNIVVLDGEGRPTHIAYFDTCKGGDGVVVERALEPVS
jgi:hypothetical protein